MSNSRQRASVTNEQHRAPSIEEIRKRIEDFDRHEWVRHAIMYQFLICGRISEVIPLSKNEIGLNYCPRGIDALEVDIEVDDKTVPTILFPVKTAKRGGRLRPCLIPRESKYERWTEPVFEYFLKVGKNYTFNFSQRGYSRYIVEIFDGFEWPFPAYTNRNKIRIDERWKPFRSHELRKARAHELIYKFRFDSMDISLFGGWSSSSVDSRMPAVVTGTYLLQDIHSVQSNIDTLMVWADSYFFKLINPRSTESTKWVYHKREA